MESSGILLTTAYFAPVHYFGAIAGAKSVHIEACETFQKQSYRNRCVIYSPDGPQTLLVPVLHKGSRLIRDIRIDYSKNWIHLHRRALSTAYGPSPYYTYYKDEIEAILEKRHTFLFDLNCEATEKLLELLMLPLQFSFTTDYEKTPASATDLRSAIHPKKAPATPGKEYYQPFCGRHGFLPGLSALDLLFCEGPQAADYL